jgi:MFS family permease
MTAARGATSAVRLTTIMCVAEAASSGSTMAVYSFIGFTSAFLAPLVFGVTLDLGGGNQSTFAWGLAFTSIGIFGVLAPGVRWLASRRRDAITS